MSDGALRDSWRMENVFIDTAKDYWSNEEDTGAMAVEKKDMRDTYAVLLRQVKLWCGYKNTLVRLLILANKQGWVKENSSIELFQA